LPYTVALIGNPNVGKSVVFNNLVPGARQHVGNWPGKTVDKKYGKFSHRGTEIDVVDLPGTYSLTARAVDELIARNFIVEEKPEVVVNIVDASNLERNLYLTMLLLELNTNVVVALNMMDIAEEKGYEIDVENLSERLGVPVVPMVATKKRGMERLKDVILEAVERRRVETRITYGGKIEKLVDSITRIINKDVDLVEKYPARWMAIKLLENDEDVLDKIEGSAVKGEILDAISMGVQEVLGEDPEIALADKRYEIISEILETSLVKGRRKWSSSDMLDKVFLDKWLGIPIFFSFMWMLFTFSIETSAVYMTLIEAFMEWLGSLFAGIGNKLMASLLVDGIIGGLGGVLVFVPPIFFTFLGVSILEDSGYMARAAFVVDRIMYKLGLHGRSFIPLLLGFGCNVPGIMACRSIEGEKDRLVTMLVNPLMSCGARLPVYVLIAGAFWSSTQASGIVWSMYLLGMVLAVIVAFLLRKTILRGEPAPFIIELPPYRAPTLHGLVVHMWERGALFLKKTGTYLLGAGVLVWFLINFPMDAPIEQTYAGMIGHAVEPLLRPLGFDWRIGVALVFGLLAKEVVVEALGIIFAVEGEAAISSVIASTFTPVQGLALMVFVLLYVPCIAVVATVKAETNSWKWTLFGPVYQTILAWIMAYLVVVIGGAVL